MVGSSERIMDRPWQTDPGHELPACRRTHGRDVKVGEPYTLLRQQVDVWRLQDRIPMSGYVTIALVVGDDENHVGPGAIGRQRRCAECKGGQKSDDCIQFHCFGFLVVDAVSNCFI